MMWGVKRIVALSGLFSFFASMPTVSAEAAQHARTARTHRILNFMPTVAELSRRAYPALLEWDGVGSIPANSDAQKCLLSAVGDLKRSLVPLQTVVARESELLHPTEWTNPLMRVSREAPSWAVKVSAW